MKTDIGDEERDALRRAVLDFAARMAEIEEESRARCAETGESPTHRVLIGIDLETPNIAVIPIDPFDPPDPPEGG